MMAIDEEGISKVITIHPAVDKNVVSSTVVMLEEKSGITKVVGIHPLGTLNACTRFSVNPYTVVNFDILN